MTNTLVPPVEKACALNPFLQVYTALLEMIIRDSRFAVKSGDVIRFDTTNRDPIKNNPITDDYPEVMLVAPSVAAVNLYNTSSSSMLIRNYEWVIGTGDYRMEFIFDVEWAIFAAMTKWCQQLTILEWEEELFVKRVNINGSTMGDIESLKRRGINGWASSWIVEVEMHFTTSKLRQD